MRSKKDRAAYILAHVIRRQGLDFKSHQEERLFSLRHEGFLTNKGSVHKVSL